MRTTAEKKLLTRMHLGSVSIELRKCEFVTRRVPFGPNKRMHWALRHKWTRAWKEAVWYCYLDRKQLYPFSHTKLPLNKAMVDIEIHTIAEIDTDNLHALCKPIIDGLKPPSSKNDIGAGIIVDDSPSHLELSVAQIRVRRRDDEGVVVNIYA